MKVSCVNSWINPAIVFTICSLYYVLKKVLFNLWLVIYFQILRLNYISYQLEIENLILLTFNPMSFSNLRFMEERNLYMTNQCLFKILITRNICLGSSLFWEPIRHKSVDIFHFLWSHLYGPWWWLLLLSCSSCTNCTHSCHWIMSHDYSE